MVRAPLAEEKAMPRCTWAEKNALEGAYHDTEWGVPVHDDRRLFELLVLEGAQAGLSWETILRKRERYRAAFDGFDPATVARYGEDKVGALVADAGIVRHAGKIRATIRTASAVLAIARERGSFDAFVWSYVGGTPVRNRPRTRDDIPATTPAATALSADLKRRGCAFVGPTIVYAFMQAAGLVDDHLVGCPAKPPAAR